MNTANLETLVNWFKENKQFTKEELSESAKKNGYTPEEFKEAWNKYKPEQNAETTESKTITDQENTTTKSVETLQETNPTTDTNPVSSETSVNNEPIVEKKTEIENEKEKQVVNPVSENIETFKPTASTKNTADLKNINSDTSPKKTNSFKKILFVIVGILILLGFAITAYAIVKKNQGKTNDNNNDNKTSELSTKYQKDTDKDLIPDALEEEIGTDPNLSIYEICNKNTCQDTALKKIPKTNILFIMDASGSMSQKINGVSKMDIAKQAMNQLLDNLNTTNLDMGLMVYGLHGSNLTSQKALSCSKIDLLQPLGNNNKTALKSSINTLKATGWTPIEKSLEQSISAFDGKEGQNNNVILITDGIEQCGGTPVNAASKLANKNIKVSVVGFGISSSDEGSLSAISTAGKGTFTNAGTSTALINAIKAKVNNTKAIYKDADCKTSAKAQLSKCMSNTYYEDLSKINKIMSGESKKNGYKSKRYIELKKIYQNISTESSKLVKKINTEIGNMGLETKKKILNDRNKTNIDTTPVKTSTPKKSPYVSGFE